MRRENRDVPAPKGRPGKSTRSNSGNSGNGDTRKRIRPTMGLFPSIKMGRMVNYTSLIELDLLYILDFHPQVIDFKERPYAFEYPHISECKKEAYMPDYIVRTPERLLLVECLTHKLLDMRATKDRHAALRLWCATNNYGLEFSYVTERTLRSGCYLSNVKLLTQYSRVSVDAPTRANVFNILEENPLQLTLGQLTMRLNPDFPDDAIPDLLHLVYNAELYVPLHDWVVTGDSPVCLPYQLPGVLIPPPNFHTNIPALAFLDGYDGPQEGR